MLIQFYDVGSVFVYCAVNAFIILKAIDWTDRSDGVSSPKIEVEGLDINLHGENRARLSLVQSPG